MYNLKQIEPRIYGINEKELPHNSFIEYNTTEELDCILTPFILGGEGDSTFNQLNWINMYLVKQLGCYLDTYVNEKIEENGLEEVMKDLPKELIEKIENEPQKTKIKRLIEFSKPLEQKIYELKIDIRNNNKDLQVIKEDLRLIKEVLGVSQPDKHRFYK